MEPWPFNSNTGKKAGRGSAKASNRTWGVNSSRQLLCKAFHARDPGEVRPLPLASRTIIVPRYRNSMDSRHVFEENSTHACK